MSKKCSRVSSRTLEPIVKLEIYFQIGYIHLNKKTKLKISTILNTNSSLFIITVLVLLCINAMKN